MRVLVTGGAGLIGMALRETLAAAGHEIVATDIANFGRYDTDLVLLPLDDSDRLEALVRDRGIDAIIHCAAISGPMLARGKPMLLVDANITVTARLLDLARRTSVRRFVNCSSIGVYGNVGPGIISEDTPLRPTSVYGASKVAGEALVDGFSVEYGLEGVSLRIGRVYGPYRRANCYLGDIVRNAAAGRPTRIECDPAFPYHYIYATDVAEAALAALIAPQLPARVYNVGGGVAMTMPEIVAAAREVLPDAEIELVTGTDDVPDLQTAFDQSRIKRDLGWSPRFDLGSGLLSYGAAIVDGRAAGSKDS